MVEMCRAAIAADIREIGFTEHLDLHPNDPDRDFFRPEEWWRELRSCRKEFQGTLTIRAGIELSEPHQHSEIIQRLLSRYPWDFTLGSLHWVGDGMIFDHNYFDLPEQDAYGRYFAELERMVSVGNFDILAHMDMVKRYGFEHYGEFDPTEYESQIRSILRTIAGKDIALEINTAPLRRLIKETSPSKQILRWFHEEGGKWITLGSDAHNASDVGYGLTQVMRDLRTIGFESIASYVQHRPSPVVI